MFKIVKSNEAIEIKSINILIYGEPGAGKTSLANTSNNSLTLDFDKGAHRSEFRKDIFVVENWKQINDNFKDFIGLLKNYNTIALDTVDTLLDFMGAWIIDQEPKLAKNKLQFYGRLKEEFSLFINRIKTLGKDIVMIAHVKEKDEGEGKIKRPAITGGSYDRVLQTADFVGYLFINNNKRTIDFNPTDYYIGKNSAKLPIITIPDYNTENNFFAELIDKMKSSINNLSESQHKAVIQLQDIKEQLASISTAKGLNGLFESCKDLANGMRKQVWEAILEKANSFGIPYNKQTKKFEEPIILELPQSDELSFD